MKRDVAIALVLFGLGLWQNLSDLRLTPFHPDESRWLYRAGFVGELRDPLGPFWDDHATLRVQPPLASYLMGAGLLLQGRDLDTNGRWNFNYGTIWNRVNGNMASPADLDAGRRTNAVVGALTVVVVYLLGLRLTNRVGAAVGALVLAAHPLMIALASQAVADALLTLLVALAALAAARLGERPGWGRALTLGALLGLGAATKLTPLAVAAGLAGLGGLLLARSWWSRHRGQAGTADARLGRMLIALPAVALAVFVAVFPYLWSDPVGRTRTLVEFRAQEMASQGSIWDELAVGSRSEALRRVGVTLGDRYSTTGRLAAKLAHGLGREWERGGIDLPLALIGAEVLVVLAITHGARGGPTLAILVLGGQVVAILLGLRADFARYHLPIALAAAVGIGAAAGQAWALAARPAARRWVGDRVYALLDRAMPDALPVPRPSASAARRPRPAPRAPPPAGVRRRNRPGRRGSAPRAAVVRGHRPRVIVAMPARVLASAIRRPKAVVARWRTGDACVARTGPVRRPDLPPW